MVSCIFPPLLRHHLYSRVLAVIRAGLVWGKLSQTTQSLQVIRSTSRTFEREQWQALEKRLVAWRLGLENVLNVVASAKKHSSQAAT